MKNEYMLYSDRITWIGYANSVGDLKAVAERIFGHCNVMMEDKNHVVPVVQNLKEALDERSSDSQKETKEGN